MTPISPVTTSDTYATNAAPPRKFFRFSYTLSRRATLRLIIYPTLAAVSFVALYKVQRYEPDPPLPRLESQLAFVAVAPTEPPLEEMPSQDLLKKAMDLRAAENCREAMRYFEKALSSPDEIAHKPYASQGWAARGMCEFELGRHANAKASFEKAAATDSKNQVARSWLSFLNTIK